uniref:High mobility group protein B2 n=1 Tax=Neolamprologus brichardi TaxID=32507 RepID=A0A3Q4IFW6_NEOBR
MGKDPKKPRGKMSSYAYFVQTCREEHKKKHPDASVNFSEFSKKCSERWKTMSPKEKGKFEDMAKQDKLRYEREMKNYVPPKGQKKKRFKDPNAPKRPPSAFFLFCADFRPKIKSENPGLSIGDTAKKLGEMWNSSSAEEKQPYEKKAAKLKEKYDKVIIQNDMEVKLVDLIEKCYCLWSMEKSLSLCYRILLLTAQREKWIQDQLLQLMMMMMTMKKKKRKEKKKRKMRMMMMSSSLGDGTCSFVYAIYPYISIHHLEKPKSD